MLWARWIALDISTIGLQVDARVLDPQFSGLAPDAPCQELFCQDYIRTTMRTHVEGEHFNLMPWAAPLNVGEAC